ncbi:MAG: hypothetical protein C4334_13990 [Pyrinomonas sp.]
MLFQKTRAGNALLGRGWPFSLEMSSISSSLPDQAASLAYFPADGNLARSDFSGSHLLYKCAKSASFQRSAGEQ